MPRDPDNAALRRYLLGLLPEPDAEALEDEYLARPEVLEQVRGVEDDLLDDYAAGRLAAAEIEPFEKRYLGTPALRERVVAARALHLAANTGARPERVPSPAPRGGVRPAALLALAASLLLAVVAFWLLPARVPTRASASSPPPSSVAPARTPPPSTTNAPEVSVPAVSRVVLVLSPVLLRSESRPAELKLANAATSVLLELEGDRAALPGAGVRLEAEIRTVEGARVWTGDAARSTDSERKGRLASITVPASRLPTGDYLVTLSARGEPLHRYFLRVRAAP